MEFSADLIVPDSMRSSQTLILEQLEKVIVYIAEMNENIKGMREEMRKGFVELPERIAKALRESNQKCFAEKAFL